MVAIIGTVGVPACYGGFETLVDNLLNDKGDYTVYCSSMNYKVKLDSYKSARLVYLPLNANGVSSILYDVLSIFHALFSGHRVLLILGVSAGLIIPLVKIFTRRKLVTNIDGLEWRREKWSRWAKWYLKLSERAAVRFSDVVIADNQGIADYVFNEYGVVANVIAYGGDHVLVRGLIQKNDRYAFSVCRVEPENNVHMILEAFSKVDKKIKFVGNWGSSEYGRELKRSFSSFENIDLIDPVYDLQELFNLREACDFYVHGHSAGGTNPSLVEAMFFSKPILAYDCIYNRATMNNKGYYFSDVASLMLSIDRVYDKQELGQEMRAIAESKYTWKEVRKRYLDVICS